MDRPLSVPAARSLLREAFVPCGTDRWGIEVEWVVRRRGDGAGRPGHGDLSDLLQRPLPGGGRVTLEPGGQVEVSTLAHESVDAALDAVTVDEAAIRVALAGRGWELDDTALDLERLPERILQLPRYRAMEAFFDASGPAGRWMMCNTASLQVNISHDPADADGRWRLMHLLAPVLVAIFANSPGRDVGGQPWASLRQGIWGAIDPGRTTAPGPCRTAADSWADYALAADVMLVRDGDDAEPVGPGTPFARWLDSDVAGRRPTPEDLRYHQTTLFPPVRPRGWLELRALDALDAATREVAVLVVAACMRPSAADTLWNELPDEARLWRAAARHGLEDPVLGAAADVVMGVAVEHVGAVTQRPERRQAVLVHAEEFVSRRLQPWGGRASERQWQTPVDLTRV